jgi:hypothetical protein
MRTLAASLVSLLVVGLPFRAAGQTILAGGALGVVESRQLRERAADSETRTGFLAGVWADVLTPARPLHVLAEVAYVRRGGTFPLDGPSGLKGDVEADYLSTTVAPLLWLGVGSIGAFLYAGPTFETPIRTRSAAELRAAYANPSDQGISATAGAGLEWLGPRWVVRGEARVVEGLSSAFSGAAGEYRHRSIEVLLRVGRAGLR